MIPLTGELKAIINNPVSEFLKEALKYLGEKESPHLSNRSTRIDYWLLETGVGLGLPWCAAYVTGVGRQALGHAWPVPFSASVQILVDWAKKKECFYDAPVKGDLFVIYFPNLSRYGHIGIVTEVIDGAIKTIEGNTNPGGSRDGWGVFERTRKLSDGIKYIRWMDLL